MGLPGSGKSSFVDQYRFCNTNMSLTDTINVSNADTMSGSNSDASSQTRSQCLENQCHAEATDKKDTTDRSLQLGKQIIEKKQLLS